MQCAFVIFHHDVILKLMVKVQIVRKPLLELLTMKTSDGMLHLKMSLLKKISKVP